MSRHDRDSVLDFLPVCREQLTGRRCSSTTISLYIMIEYMLGKFSQAEHHHSLRMGSRDHRTNLDPRHTSSITPASQHGYQDHMIVLVSLYSMKSLRIEGLLRTHQGGVPHVPIDRASGSLGSCRL
jgi:hypothetical protein